MLETAPHAPVTYASKSAKSIGEMFRTRVRWSGSMPALYEKRGGDGIRGQPDSVRPSATWHKTTWTGFYDDARRVLAGLLAAGLTKGDKVAILGETKRAWAIIDMGAQLGGYVSYGIYPKQPPEALRYLIEHGDAKAVFVDSAAELERVLEATKDACPQLTAIVPWSDALAIQYADRDPRIVLASRFGLDGEGAAPADEATIDRLLAAVDPQDTAILVYTSGTTGPPKAAMLSHFNILDLLSSQSQFLELYADDLSLSFLPMAHVAERILAFYGRIATGFATAYATSSATVLQELQEVQPTVFGSVPRIFEKAYAKAMSEIAKKPAAVRKLFAWALDVSSRRIRLLHANKPVPLPLRLQHALADRLVWKRVRQVFGGRVRLFVTGAAPIALSILEFFWAANLPIYEAYGMTEATVATHINMPGAIRLGSVGRCVSRMQCHIAPDGEILLAGPWVFQGYYKNPEATAEMIKPAIDLPEGRAWLHTGDIGVVDADGFLRITDRKKHLIITAGGKNLAPANIEKALREASPLIAQVHAHGDRRPYVTAIVAPSPIETLELGVELGLITKPELDERTAELLANPTNRSAALEASMRKVTGHSDFQSRIRQAVARGNKHLAQVEQVRRFALLDRDFSQERGEVTPTMKLKRKGIETLHAALIDRLYDDPTFGLEP